MAEKKMKPVLRFKGFTDEWEQKKLLSIATMHARIGWQNLRKSEFLVSGDYYLITGTDFIDGEIDLANCHFVTKDRYDQDVNIQIESGSILITKDGTLGKVAFVKCLDKPATLNAGVFNVLVRDKKIIYGKYLFQYLKAPFLMNYVAQKATGGTIKHLNQNILVDFPVLHPVYNEQVLLGNCFEIIDNLISFYQQKYEKLVNVKKSMLKKMFPQNGSAYPAIRFSGFTAPWEQRKLGELGTLKNGMNFSKDAMGIGFPFVNLQDIFGKSQINEENLGKAMASPRQLRDYNLIEGDVLFVRSSVKLEGVGEAALVPKSLENTTYSGFIIRFRDEIGLDNNFKRFIFSTEDVRKQMVSQATDSANKNISQTVLSNLEFFLPKREEQIAIGAFLSSIDNLITLHQSKLEKLKNLKKSMLQRMFV